MSFQYSQRDKSKSYILFHVTITANKFWNYAEMMLLNMSFANDEHWTVYSFYSRMERKRIPKGVYETHPSLYSVLYYILFSYNPGPSGKMFYTELAYNFLWSQSFWHFNFARLRFHGNGILFQKLSWPSIRKKWSRNTFEFRNMDRQLLHQKSCQIFSVM